MIDLTGYGAIQSNLFVELFITKYRTSPTGNYQSTTLRFSDKLGTSSLNGQSYIGTGSLMGVTQSRSDIQITDNETTITLSGIPDEQIGEILYSQLKGSSVIIRRAFANNFGDFINIPGNPVLRFSGIINKISITEEFDNGMRTATNTLSIVCSSKVDVLDNKIAGRKTNPASHKKFYANDISMDRVPNLENSNFNFGAKL